MKLLLVLWSAGEKSRSERRTILLTNGMPALLKAGAEQLSVLIADEHAAVRSPSPFPLFGRKPVAMVSLWGSVSEAVAVTILAELGFTVASYHVDESVYRDYGDNDHATPRDWPDGQRSPGITAVTFMERPARLSETEWLRRWHERMSPVSESILPRTRYVRNHIRQASAGAPPLAGIVEEAFPSPRHITQPMLFYGASGPLSLVINVLRILAAVTHFLTLWRIQTVVMSEYFIHTASSEPQ